MKELRHLRDHLERFQDEQDARNGCHIPITLTVSVLAELLNQIEDEERSFCQEP